MTKTKEEIYPSIYYNEYKRTHLSEKPALYGLNVNLKLSQIKSN